MKYIKTMAVIISEETYPIAVACLAHGFATIPFGKVVGSILVINEICTKPNKKRNGEPILTLSNSWMSTDDFADMYRPIGLNFNFTKFLEVEKISN